jgi:hypothetical protein
MTFNQVISVNRGASNGIIAISKIKIIKSRDLSFSNTNEVITICSVSLSVKIANSL